MADSGACRDAGRLNVKHQTNRLAFGLRFDGGKDRMTESRSPKLLYTASRVETASGGSGRRFEANQNKTMIPEAKQLVEIVEGVRSVRWAHGGLRLKDTPEWCAFYVAFNKSSAASALGSVKSKAKSEAARLNGAKGGRPKKPAPKH